MVCDASNRTCNLNRREYSEDRRTCEQRGRRPPGCNAHLDTLQQIRGHDDAGKLPGPVSPAVWACEYRSTEYTHCITMRRRKSGSQVFRSVVRSELACRLKFCGSGPQCGRIARDVGERCDVQVGASCCRLDVAVFVLEADLDFLRSTSVLGGVLLCVSRIFFWR
jgi:hypothetical protein